MGRNPNQRIPKAYDYRRVIFLVQILAMDKKWCDKGDLFRHLFAEWGVQDRLGRKLEHLEDIDVLEELAVHTLAYSKTQTEKHNTS